MEARSHSGNSCSGRIRAAALIALGGLAVPFLARFLVELDHTMGRQLPLAVCTVALCLLLPRHGTAYLAVLAAALGELAMMAVASGRTFGPSTVAALWGGHWRALLWVGAAIGLGHLTVLLRRRRDKLWRWRTKTNVRLLTRRPGVLVRAYRWPLVLLAVGTSLDTITTMAFMYSTGAGSELHPAMRMMADEFGVTFGVPIASVFRMGFVVFVACVWRRWCAWVLCACGVLYLLAAASNHFQWL